MSMLRSCRLSTRILFVAVIGLMFMNTARAGSKPKKPHLEVRARPPMAFSPATISFTAELIGGDDLEDFYCPELEWDWDDGGKSVEESDCPPYQKDTKIERRFTTDHVYQRAGAYGVKLTLRHENRTLATQSVKVTVRAGLGDPTLSGF